MSKVETEVLPENGQWAVYIIVMMEDGVVRKRIEAYFTKKRAEIAADLIKRTAERDIHGPIHGMS